jgi:nucleoside-diphosphate-sugar epimerase
MRVFVAGATGAVGRRLVPMLVAAGYSVIGLTRAAAKADAIRAAGAEAAIADGLDGPAMRRIVSAARPDVVIHEMTALEGATDYRHFERSFAVTNRLRREGLDILLACAKAAGAQRFIAQSYCGWPYARTGDAVKDESAPLDPDPPAQFRSTLAAIRHLEAAVASAAGIDGLVLRYGAFYGPNTGMLHESALALLRRRSFPLIGDGGGWWSFLHIDDAAAATLCVAERGAPGIYNIVDDEPAPARDWLPALAEMLGAEPPRHIPKWLGRIAAGPHIVVMMTETRAGSNAKAKRDLAWRATHPSWRSGFREVLSESKVTSA